MAADDSTRQSLAWKAESSWGEAATTMDYGIQHNDPVTLDGISQPMLPPERVLSGRLDGTSGIPGAFTEVKLGWTCHATGHGSATTGATSISDLPRLVGNTLGGSGVSAPAGDTFSGGSATVPTTTTAAGSNQIVAGSLIRGGVHGDGRGEGRFYRVGEHSGSNLTLLTGFPVAPNNLDLLYSASIAYPKASEGAVAGTRVRVQTADGQAVLHGGFPTEFGFAIEPGMPGKFSFGYQFSYPEMLAATFPTTPTNDTFSPSPWTADSACFFQPVGTATGTVASGALISLRAFSMQYTVGMAPQPGGTGVSAYQTFTGATRTKDTCIVSITVDAEGADTTPTWWDRWLANLSYHMLITFNTKATQALGVYFPNLCFTGNRPFQSTMGGRNVVTMSFYAKQGATTSDVTNAPVMWGFA
jgi:hypothetical protein